MFDVDRVRAAYPALRDGHAYLDGAAGTQLPAVVIDAIGDAYRAGIGNTGGAFAASRRSEAIEAGCRQAIADLTGSSPDGVILGPSMTALTYRLASALSRDWRPGDEVVVSRLDHDANIRPWVQAAERAGASVRWAEVDKVTGELPIDQYAGLLSGRTRLVAVTAASNIIGTRPDVPAMAAAAHAAGALCYVDGVHATPHIPVDVTALGADFYATSAYKWSGPHVGAVAGKPEVLAALRPDKLVPAPDTVPERFERGTLPFGDLAGVTAAVDHLASLASGIPGGTATSDATAAAPSTSFAPSASFASSASSAAPVSRRERVLASMAEVERYETALFGRMMAGLAAMDHVTLYGSAARRAPTAFFTVAGWTPLAVAERLADRGINVWNGDNYAWELCRALGLPDGAVRAGPVHYNDASDVDRLLAAVADLAGHPSA